MTAPTTYLTHASTEVFAAVPAEPEPIEIPVYDWQDLLLTLPLTIMIVGVLAGPVLDPVWATVWLWVAGVLS